MIKRSFFALVVLLLAMGTPKNAKAVDFGDAALTVSVATLSGAVLGLSTLPFYDDSGKHTKNIFYGAAIGAVAGVLISAYSGVKEGPSDDEEDALLLDPKSSKRRETLLAAGEKRNRFSLTENSNDKNSVLVWAPLFKYRF